MTHDRRLWQGIVEWRSKRLRKHHIFIKNTEELLAPAKAYLPENVPEPAGAEDMETLRVAFRYNEAADCGFLFINNHQRKRKMTEKQITPEKPLQFTVSDVEGTQKQINFDRLHVRTDAILVLPYNLPVVIRGEQFRLRKTNASYLGCFGGTYYFYTDETPEDVYFEWSDGKEHPEAVRILTTHEAEPTVCELTLKYENCPADAMSEEVWLELDPFRADVYYDLSPKKENRLTGARLVRLG